MSRVKKYKPRKGGPKVSRGPEKWLTKKKLWTIIIGVIMVASVFGIMLGSFNSGDEDLKYGKYMFKRSAGGWMITVNGEKQLFTYHPSDVDRLPVEQEVLERLRESKVVYITFNPNSQHVQAAELLRFEFGNALSHIFNIYTMPGVTRLNETYDLPFVTCANATRMVPVVHISALDERSAADMGARMSGDCIMLKTDQYSPQALSDRIMYGLLGVIEETVPSSTAGTTEPVPDSPAEPNNDEPSDILADDSSPDVEKDIEDVEGTQQ